MNEEQLKQRLAELGVHGVLKAELLTDVPPWFELWEDSQGMFWWRREGGEANGPFPTTRAAQLDAFPYFDG